MERVKLWILLSTVQRQILLKTSSALHNLKLTAVDNKITAVIDGETVTECEDKTTLGAGRAALFSSYNNNSFDNIKLEPVEGAETYVRRYDNTDIQFGYNGSWTHNTMDTFRNYKRTVSEGETGAEFTFDFKGTGFGFTGVNNEASIEVEIDGETSDTNYAVENKNFRSVFYFKSGLENKEHTVKVKVLSGALSIDGAQITGVYADKEDVKDTAKSESKGGSKKNVLPVVAGAAVAAAAVAAAVVIRKKKKKS